MSLTRVGSLFVFLGEKVDKKAKECVEISKEIKEELGLHDIPVDEKEEVFSDIVSSFHASIRKVVECFVAIGSVEYDPLQRGFDVCATTITSYTHTQCMHIISFLVVVLTIVSCLSSIKSHLKKCYDRHN
jgi:hypothetical protein